MIRSHHLYVALAPADIALFRFLLEAYDNLAIFTVVDRKRTVLKLRHAPGALQELRSALADIASIISFTILPSPLKPWAPSADTAL